MTNTSDDKPQENPKTSRWVRCLRCGASWDAVRWPNLVGCVRASGDTPGVSEVPPDLVSGRNFEIGEGKR